MMLPLPSRQLTRFPTVFDDVYDGGQIPPALQGLFPPSSSDGSSSTLHGAPAEELFGSSSTLHGAPAEELSGSSSTLHGAPAHELFGGGCSPMNFQSATATEPGASSQRHGTENSGSSRPTEDLQEDFQQEQMGVPGGSSRAQRHGTENSGSSRPTEDFQQEQMGGSSRPTEDFQQQAMALRPDLVLSLTALDYGGTPIFSDFEVKLPPAQPPYVFGAGGLPQREWEEARQKTLVDYCVEALEKRAAETEFEVEQAVSVQVIGSFGGC